MRYLVLAAIFALAACSSLPNTSQGEPVLPAPSSASLISISGTTWDFTGTISYHYGSGLWGIQGGAGVGYVHFSTPSSTVYDAGVEPLHVGQSIEFIGTKTGYTMFSATHIKKRPGPSPSPSISPSPVPSPTTAPTVVPSATPVPVDPSAYTYAGRVVYTANDWFTTNLQTGGSSYVSNTVDPNSAAYINALAAAFGSNTNFNGSGDNAHLEAVNLATNSTPLVTVSSSSPFKNDPYNDDPDSVIPWQSGFLQEGTFGGQYDDHNIVLNTDTGVDYETYIYGKTSWNGSTYTASNGYVHNLNYPFNNQYSTDGNNMTGAGLPLLGTTDFGEDASLASINHIVGLFLPTVKAAGSHYVAPATGDEACTASCGTEVPYGARFRLKASYPCPTTPQALLVCNQLKTRGAILMDNLAGYPNNYQIRFGLSANGTNPWNSSDLNNLFNNLHITNFDIMTLGTIR